MQNSNGTVLTFHSKMSRYLGISCTTFFIVLKIYSIVTVLQLVCFDIYFAVTSAFSSLS